MRLDVALAAAAVICALLGAYASYDRDVIEKAVRQHLRELKERNELPAELRDVDIDSIDATEFDVEVRPAMILRQGIAEFLWARWYLWVPLVFMGCVGVAWLASLVFAMK